MNITEIRTNEPKPFIPRELRPEEKKVANVKINQDQMEISNNSISWQNDILMSALDMLENNIQLDNSHPLDSVANQPIETFEEAILELRFLQTDTFKAQGSLAQANINAVDVLSLFLNDN